MKKKSTHFMVDTESQLREAIGAGPGEEIHIITPQFERPAGSPEPDAPPIDMHAFISKAASMGVEELRKMGLGAWGAPEDSEGNEIVGQGMLWLFPGEWYAHIPSGLPIMSITFEKEIFVPGKTDDDIRFGCLPYGVMGPELPTHKDVCSTCGQRL